MFLSITVMEVIMNKFYLKLFSFLFSFIVSTPLFSCAGFFKALSEFSDTKEAAAEIEQNEEFKKWLSCTHKPEFQLSLATGNLELCSTCLLNFVSAQIFCDSMPEGLTLQNDTDKIDVNGISVYNSHAFDNNPTALKAISEAAIE